MRVSVHVTPRTPPPPEALPDMFQAFQAWRDRYRDQMETFQFFVGGGGMGIINGSDEAELQRIITEFPFTPFSNMDVRVIVDGDVALRQWGEMLAAMAAR